MPQPVHTKGRIDFRRDIFAILFLALGIFTGLCLFSYTPTDPALNSVSNATHVKNLGGIVGAYLADILFIIFGVSAFLSAGIFLLMSVLQFLGRSIRLRLREIFYYVGMIASASTLIHLRFETVAIRGQDIAGGGVIGALLGETLQAYLNRPGAYIFSIAAFILFFTLSTKLSLNDMIGAVKKVALLFGQFALSFGGKIGAFAAAGIKGGTRSFFTALRGKLATMKKSKAAPEALGTFQEPMVAKAAPADRDPEPREEREASDVVTLAPIRRTKASLSAPAAQTTPPLRTDAAPVARTARAEMPAEESAAPGSSPKILKRADTKLRATDDQLKFHRMTSEGYEAPPFALLDMDEGKKIEVNEETLKKNSLLLEKKLKDFDVEGKVLAIHPGPVITMYEFEPSAGTKLNKIVGLQDDLSLTLGGRSVRIVPHLPGKAALGIEIPSSEREIVYLRSIVSAPQYAKSQSRLPLALGSSTAGHPVITDLTKMPHLLVAGATGSGKSVAINSFIISIIMKSAPEDVRFIMVDPKMLELSIYDGIPHLLLPVVTKPKRAVTAMKWAIREMERRYRLMADAGTRNILGYNDKIKSGQIELVSDERAQEMVQQDPEAAAHTGKMPYIVIIIDELADLMMTASQEMEECITRLAQMARAAGIHLVLATQRPSVDVITGLIKANFPARIAFKVTAKHDSRTILDAIGAETLLGNGDMLFMTPQGGNVIRIHGAYVSDSDISRVVEHLKSQGAPVYDESILKESETTSPGAEFEEGDDELYDQAVRLVAETKQASISMVQRRLRIGYNRAARMIERMEAEGVVGPADGSRPRQVLLGGAEA
jgi:S-DNA-T family DNA segregation ATPase FtsK/SpoIIIE